MYSFKLLQKRLTWGDTAVSTLASIVSAPVSLLCTPLSCSTTTSPGKTLLKARWPAPSAPLLQLLHNHLTWEDIAVSTLASTASAPALTSERWLVASLLMFFMQPLRYIRGSCMEVAGEEAEGTLLLLTITMTWGDCYGKEVTRRVTVYKRN